MAGVFIIAMIIEVHNNQLSLKRGKQLAYQFGYLFDVM